MRCVGDGVEEGRDMGVELETRPEEALGVDRARRDSTATGSRYVFAGVAVAMIWLGTAAASIWSPDLISGTEGDHVPLAAILDWSYAALATGLVLIAYGRRSPGATRSLWLGFTVAIGGIWFVVAIASILAPSIVSGTDATTVPVAVLASPIAGLIATAFVSVFVAGSAGELNR